MSVSGSSGSRTAWAAASGANGSGGVPYAPESSARISSDTSAQRRAVSTWVTAWPARMPPIGCASGAVPQSARTRFSSVSASSRRSSESAARRRASMSATRPTGRREIAVRRMIRGGTGSAGMREVTCASMKRDASHTRSTSTPCSSPRPVSASHRTSAETRFRSDGHRIGGDGDRLGAVAGGLDRHRQRLAAGALAVEAGGHARGLGQALDDAARRAGVERAGRVVQQHALGAELGQAAGLLDHALEVAHLAREGQAAVEPPARLAHGGGGRGQVLDVVQRVVQAEDVDAALGRRQDEAAHQVVGDGL